MKEQIDVIRATPSKRLFLSIIADYDLLRSICELVDNGLDVWVRGGKSERLQIDIRLNEDQQTIVVEDNAGGLEHSELRNIVGPGHSGSSPDDEVIGIFGVGTKRAVVALAQEVRIRTRSATSDGFEIGFDDDWLSEESWDLPLFRVDGVSPGSTIVELSRLRIKITEDAVSNLIKHLSAVYGKFITTQAVEIAVNGETIQAVFFDNFAYPPGYEPRNYSGQIETSDGRSIQVQALAGLSNESSPATGEYGVYFYCNDRLISRAVKNFEVGFMKGYAGVPHPKVSLTKVILSLRGGAELMPWNSSKSEINTKHEVFQAIRTWLMEVVKDYAKLSRIWMGDWPNKVFKHTEGEMVNVAIESFPQAKTSYLPPAPKTQPRFAERVSTGNQEILKKKPWTRGLLDGIISVDVISGQRTLSHKNRINLIILDSTLEIAFKEYLVNDSGTYYGDAKLLKIFASRHEVHSEIKKTVSLDPDVWKKIVHYHDVRNKLVHQRATSTVADPDVLEFRQMVESVLQVLFGLKV